MTSLTITRTLPQRSAPAIACQRVGGYSARATVTAVLVVSLVVAASLFCVWSRTQVVKQGYALSELAREIKDRSLEQERLQAEAAALRSPERIEAVALEKLGLRYPGPEQIRTVEWRPDAKPMSLADQRAGNSSQGR